ENGSKTLNNCPKKLLLASPRGFCAGVKRAIDALNQALTTFPGQNIYCYHQIVHNIYVVKEFEAKGVKFVSNLNEVPMGSIVIFSSHGVSPIIRQQALDRQLKTIDATCPFVTKTHLEVKKYAQEGAKIVYIGQKGHDEAVGTTGEAPEATTVIQSVEEIAALLFSAEEKIALVTQTTLSLDETENLRQALKKKFPRLIEPANSDICLATQNRQNGVKELVAKGAQIIVILGSANSSNSNKLKKVAEKMGAQAVLIDDILDLNLNLLQNIDCIGLTAGASLPEYKITEALAFFRNHGVEVIKEMVVADENQVSLPRVNINASK
ncbi:MAG: 4-hydroxy-3-methylbut-2-enyl diphosphate reductase, partial [Patescibacteria group bacterium]|nr:4-hydroxy-3-methylbut-2-enyl diphosphate reductase [Patescibacteria group bacterium]